MVKLTESKRIIIPDFKEFLYILHKQEIDIAPKERIKEIPFIRHDISDIKIKSSNKEHDLIEKKRALKRWKQSFSYYCLHPNKFKFGFKDMK
ncbi:MAG: hypothetical protein ACFFEY_02300 [Candidatus Thorarchaeota archaeon]